MPDTYSALYYHFVWGTKDRVEYIVPDLEALLYQYLTSKCREMGVTIFALNGMPDHVHLACSVPPRLSISDFIGTLKGTSSSYVRSLPGGESFIAWQPGYGVISYSRKELDTVIHYVQNQKTHHEFGKIWPSPEKRDDNSTTP